MYIPKAFEQTDTDALHQAISEYPFATLVSQNQQGMDAMHIPLYLDKTDSNSFRLKGHIAKANPLWKNTDKHSDVLVIFQGPNSYISPNYYPSKKIHEKVVPTWNYVAIHVKGKITFIHDAAWKMDMLNVLTDEQEQTQNIPWSVADAPDDFIEKMSNAIVGIEINIESIVGQWKTSQNKSKDDKQGVVDGLAHAEKNDMAELVNQTLKNS